MTGATRPELVTHGFCLDDSRWVHGMLQARMYPKVIENRQCRFDPGWYALSLSNGAATGVVQEMDFRKRYPNYGGPHKADHYPDLVVLARLTVHARVALTLRGRGALCRGLLSKKLGC